MGVCSVSHGWLTWELFVHVPSCKEPSLSANQNYPQITCGKKMIHAVNLVISVDQVMLLICPPSTVKIHQLNFWGALIWSIFTVYARQASVSSCSFKGGCEPLIPVPSFYHSVKLSVYEGAIRWFCLFIILVHGSSLVSAPALCSGSETVGQIAKSCLRARSDQQVTAVVDALAQLWVIMTHMVVGPSSLKWRTGLWWIM